MTRTAEHLSTLIWVELRRPAAGGPSLLQTVQDDELNEDEAGSIHILYQS